MRDDRIEVVDPRCARILCLTVSDHCYGAPVHERHVPCSLPVGHPYPHQYGQER